MRRLTALVGIAALIVAAVTVPAAAGGKDRKVSKQYTIADGVFAAHGGWGVEAHWYLGHREIFRVKPGERFVSLSISDNVGQSVRVHIHIDTNGDGHHDDVDDFCSQTPKPIALGTAEELEVAVIFGMCPGGDLSMVTQGTITATFSK